MAQFLDTQEPEHIVSATVQQPETAEVAPSMSVARSVVANWTGQAVTVISGFVLPRLINDSISPAALGVWDFGWSMGSIISISELGMGSSACHHFAHFRALGDWKRLNSVLSAALAVVLCMAMMAAGITGVICALTPRFLHPQTSELVSCAQWMVVASGAAAALRMITQLYTGVLVGSHRFDLVNLSEVMADVSMVCAIFVSLLSGWGLRVMAICIISRQLFDLFVKRALAHRLCPALHLRLRWSDRVHLREVVVYGGKTLAATVATIVLNQAVVTIIMGFAGPAAVAMFSRPMALIRNTTSIVTGYTRVLVPRAGEFQAQGNQAGLANLLIDGTRNCLFVSLPIVVLLLAFGRPLLTVWMGKAYANPTVLVILCVGYLPFLAQRSTWHILFGMGVHGLVSVASLGGAFASVALGFLFIGFFQWGLPGASLAVALPMCIVNLWITPFAACRTAKCSPRRYLVGSLTRPCKAVFPFLAVLIAIRILIPNQVYASMLAALVIGVPVLAISYWHTCLPHHTGDRIRPAWQRLRSTAIPAADKGAER
jgi:O-antigen/teichoic acid export membrane protein